MIQMAQTFGWTLNIKFNEVWKLTGHHDAFKLNSCVVFH